MNTCRDGWLNELINESYVRVLFQTAFREEFVLSWVFDMTFWAGIGFIVPDDKSCNYVLHNSECFNKYLSIIMIS